MTDGEAAKIITLAHGVDGGYGATNLELKRWIDDKVKEQP